MVDSDSPFVSSGSRPKDVDGDEYLDAVLRQISAEFEDLYGFTPARDVALARLFEQSGHGRQQLDRGIDEPFTDGVRLVADGVVDEADHDKPGVVRKRRYDDGGAISNRGAKFEATEDEPYVFFERIGEGVSMLRGGNFYLAALGREDVLDKFDTSDMPSEFVASLFDDAEGGTDGGTSPEAESNAAD